MNIIFLYLALNTFHPRHFLKKEYGPGSFICFDDKYKPYYYTTSGTLTIGGHTFKRCLVRIIHFT